MSELKFLEYITIKNRMTKRDINQCRLSCRDCPLSSTNNGTRIGCRELEHKYPEKALAIIEKWNKEHPMITNLQHYAEELRKLGFEINEQLLRLRCPIPRSTYYSWTDKSNCDKGSCLECRKWWDEEYHPNTTESDDKEALAYTE